ncbi:PP2C family protein-serine/threonine phosphatase [Streptomyces sp. NPDC006129]|uniref:PP2C family protein-serine/threonine phosphatase n=1 Tax=Streptomyces sp. NPDC006129 TaxID=3155348 RepID=UPI0033BBA53B
MVHLTILDAMGHDTAAGLSGALALGACRNARRQGAGLLAKADAVEAALLEQYDHRRYVTGVLATPDTRTGGLRWVNRGHHPPIVIRDNRYTTHLGCPPAHPMGTGLGLPGTVCEEHLQPGDRVVLYTDGIRRGAPLGRPGIRPGPVHRLPDPPPRRRAARPRDPAPLICEWIGPDLEPARTAVDLTGLHPSRRHPADHEDD